MKILSIVVDFCINEKPSDKLKKPEDLEKERQEELERNEVSSSNRDGKFFLFSLLLTI